MTERSDRRGSALGAGRPRDPHVDRSILNAARELLVEIGYQKTTITAIARRAGLGTAAIYRRWGTKESIVEDAVFSIADASLPAATADLRMDLTTWTRWFLTQIAEPATRAAIPGLLSAYQIDEGAYGLLVGRSEEPARIALTERIATAFPTQHPKAIADTADATFDLLVAATVMRGLTRGLTDAEAFCTRTADSLMLVVGGKLDVVDK